MPDCHTSSGVGKPRQGNGPGWLPYETAASVEAMYVVPVSLVADGLSLGHIVLAEVRVSTSSF